MNNIDILIDNFEQLKKNKFIIESIDPEFFFKFGEKLIQENKELKDNMGKDYIPKSKIKALLQDVDNTEFINKHCRGMYIYNNLQELLKEGE